MNIRHARFEIGQIVRHRVFPFRGVVYDVDAIFSETDDIWLSIPENARPRKDQPFYRLLAENNDGPHRAYVSEQNLIEDETGDPIEHPDVVDHFLYIHNGYYVPRQASSN